MERGKEGTMQEKEYGERWNVKRRKTEQVEDLWKERMGRRKKEERRTSSLFIDRIFETLPLDPIPIPTVAFLLSFLVAHFPLYPSFRPEPYT